MSFSANNKLVFIDSFQFLNSSLDSLVENLDKNDFKHLSQKIHCEIIDLVKQKGFYLCECMRSFEKFKEKLPGKNQFYIPLSDKGNSNKG